MDNVRTFFESSTIHGLRYIATTRSHVKTLWILVVIAGFTAAGFLIFASFQAWAESPVKTTIETHPITEITFPKVTVCPPKDTFTDLNYDLMMTKNMTLDNDTRNELTDLAVKLINEHIFDSIMKNLSKLQDDDRYYNWYNGFTGISLPTQTYDHDVHYQVATQALKGTIATQYFGEKFNYENLDKDIYYQISVLTPDGLTQEESQNLVLHFEVEKFSTMNDAGTEMFSVHEKRVNNDKVWIAPNVRKIGTNFTTPKRYGEERILELSRKVSRNYIENLEFMPGFRLSWYYIGDEKLLEELNPSPYYIRTSSYRTIGFIRNCFIIFHFCSCSLI